MRRVLVIFLTNLSPFYLNKYLSPLFNKKMLFFITPSFFKLFRGHYGLNWVCSDVSLALFTPRSLFRAHPEILILGGMPYYPYL